MNLPKSIRYRGREVLLKYHKLNDGRGVHPPNSLPALEEVLAAGVAVIEFDVSETADGEFALLHDTTLERETTGLGLLSGLKSTDLANLQLRNSTVPPATLRQVVTRLARHDKPLKIQVDLKKSEPLTRESAARLLEMLAPLRDNDSLRVVVGCLGDWNLRMLRRIDRDLLVGFDPAYYLHASVHGGFQSLPTRVNAYGYADDHPLGYRRTLPVATYLEDRLDVLISQVAGAVEFYLHKEFISRAIGDGVNPVSYLQQQTGAQVDAWTINAWDEDAGIALQTVLDAGVDQITTDTAIQVTEAITAMGAGA